jgi:large subunit ribosomal protein L18Ae
MATQKTYIHQYQVTGRKTPTDKDPEPDIYRMKIFAKSPVQAKSRFWYFLHQYKKMKKTTGDILAVREINETNPNIVNVYGITLRYYSRSGCHNMYKEYRDTSLCGAVEQLYAEMSSRHRARATSIQIRDTCIVPGPLIHKDPSIGAKRTAVVEMINSKIKFPLTHRVQRASSKKFRTTFKASRPSTYRK